MHKAMIALAVAISLAGCATTQAPVVPALNGKPRVPVNKEIPATAPLSQPEIFDTQGE
ncbi:type IV secretion system protein VirB7 [Rhizobium sp. TRM95111]|uniref:type IV secretion system protein VirB7 n=1 Tax=Rhizobium alarense TaxID=2846851 RepID=UPI001F1EE971|nr:type IV secretion system protein VirB7 [Rhizobium alarense]MCF3642949.1 type IV secretion system protein VirB7 [Rhizobium alarense]